MAGGRLIDPSAFPARSADLDLAAVRGSAASMRSMGRAVLDRTSTISSTWGRLPGCYEAPEQEQVYGVMRPAVTSAVALRTRFDDAARILDTYADALAAIKPRLADLERRARAFRARVVDGVWVDASSAAGATFVDHLRWAGDWIPGVDERRVKVPWDEDTQTYEQNAALVEEYAQIAADVSAAAAACANGITGLDQGVCHAPVEAIPAAAFTSSEHPMPWGSAGAEDRNCRESVGHGAYTFGTDLLQGAGQLVLGYNPANGDWFSGAAYGQAWGGMSDLVGSIVVLVSPVGWVAAGMSAAGNTDNAFSGWMYDRAVTVRNAGGALVGWDPTAEDGWHAWKEDGVAAGTGAVLSIGSFFIPAAGQVGAGLKAGSIGARVARISAGVSEFAVQGGSWAVKGGVKVLTGLRGIATRFDLGAFGDGFGPQLAVAGAGAGVRANPFAGLLNAMTDGSGTAAGTAGRTPLRDAFLGPRETPPLEPRHGGVPHTEGPTLPRTDAPDAPRVEAPAASRPEGPSADAPTGRVPDAPTAHEPHNPSGGDGVPTRDTQVPDGAAAPDGDLPPELRGVDLSDAAGVEKALDDMVDQAADTTDADTFRTLAAEKIAMFERLAARQDEGSFLRQLFNGSKFNWENYHRYEYREVLVEVTDPGPPPSSQRFRVDSYTPGDQVVSRKFTQLADIQEKTAIGYIDEMVRKYNPGNARLRVLGTDSNVTQFGARSRGIVGRSLRGKMVLEVPVQQGEIPESVLRHAEINGVAIRDVSGRIYLG